MADTSDTEASDACDDPYLDRSPSPPGDAAIRVGLQLAGVRQPQEPPQLVERVAEAVTNALLQQAIATRLAMEPGNSSGGSMHPVAPSPAISPSAGVQASSPWPHYVPPTAAAASQAAPAMASNEQPVGTWPHSVSPTTTPASQAVPAMPSNEQPVETQHWQQWTEEDTTWQPWSSWRQSAAQASSGASSSSGSMRPPEPELPPVRTKERCELPGYDRFEWQDEDLDGWFSNRREYERTVFGIVRKQGRGAKERSQEWWRKRQRKQ